MTDLILTVPPKRPRGRPRKDGLPAGTVWAPRQKKARDKGVAALVVRPTVTITEDGKPSMEFGDRRQAILALSRMGFGAREIETALAPVSLLYVRQVRWEARRAGILTNDVEKLINTRAVPMAAEVVTELLEDDTLKPALRYQIAKDALQTKPFASGHQGGPSGGVAPVMVGVKFEFPAGMAAPTSVGTGQVVGTPREDEPVDG